MHRFLAVVAFGLFAAACTEQRVDIFEDDGTSTGATSSDELQPGQYPKGIGIVTPVQTTKDSADTALNPSVAKALPNQIDLNGPGELLPVFGPAVDPAYDNHMGVDGTMLPTTNIDPYKVEQEPGLGLVPTIVIGLPPTEGQGMAEKSRF